MSLDYQALLRHAGALQRVVTLRELINVTWEAVRAQTRYEHVWLVLLEPEDPGYARLVEFAGSMEEVALAQCPRIPIAGDEMMAEIISARAPVVVVDARTDPRTNKQIVERLQNRTIINLPLVLGPTALGALGFGTYGDQGVMAPTDAELEALSLLSVQFAPALGRLQFLEQQRKDLEARTRLEHHLETLQRVELMGVLASGVAHDLNNYLLVVRSGITLLAEGDRAPDLLEDVTLATNQACDVVKQLLSLGRSQAPRRQPLDLNARVASTLQLVRSSMPHGVKVSHEARPVPLVQGDPVQLDQVLANLVINARDAVGRAGEIAIEVDEQVLGPDFVAAHRWARPGRFGHIGVRDTGSGISPEDLEHIFDPLFTTKSRGTGLGLAVVSRVVEQHQGLLHCQSSPGVGTTFDVYLPIT